MCQWTSGFGAGHYTHIYLRVQFSVVSSNLSIRGLSKCVIISGGECALRDMIKAQLKFPKEMKLLYTFRRIYGSKTNRL